MNNVKRFQLQISQTRLEFDKSSGYEGLVVEVRTKMPLELVLEAQAWEGKDIKGFVEKFGNLILIDWNLDDADGKELPANKEGLLKADHDLLGVITSAWVEAIGAPPPPLDLKLNNGESSEASLEETAALPVNPSG